MIELIVTAGTIHLLLLPPSSIGLIKGESSACPEVTRRISSVITKRFSVNTFIIVEVSSA